MNCPLEEETGHTCERPVHAARLPPGWWQPVARAGQLRQAGWSTYSYIVWSLLEYVRVCTSLLESAGVWTSAGLCWTIHSSRLDSAGLHCLHRCLVPCCMERDLRGNSLANVPVTFCDPTGFHAGDGSGSRSLSGGDRSRSGGGAVSAEMRCWPRRNSAHLRRGASGTLGYTLICTHWHTGRTALLSCLLEILALLGVRAKVGTRALWRRIPAMGDKSNVPGPRLFVRRSVHLYTPTQCQRRVACS